MLVILLFGSILSFILVIIHAIVIKFCLKTWIIICMLYCFKFLIIVDIETITIFWLYSYSRRLYNFESSSSVRQNFLLKMRFTLSFQSWETPIDTQIIFKYFSLLMWLSSVILCLIHFTHYLRDENSSWEKCHDHKSYWHKGLLKPTNITQKLHDLINFTIISCVSLIVSYINCSQ